jgi:hypothetical protein
MISWRNIKTVFQKEGVRRCVVVGILTTIKKAAAARNSAARANAGRNAAVSATVVEGAIAIAAISSAGSRRRPNGLLN